MENNKTKIKFFTEKLTWMAYAVLGVNFGLYTLLILTNTYDRFSLLLSVISAVVTLAFLLGLLWRIPGYIKEKRANKVDKMNG